jgi:ABC-type sugar transport system permease subunit
MRVGPSQSGRTALTPAPLPRTGRGAYDGGEPVARIPVDAATGSGTGTSAMATTTQPTDVVRSRPLAAVRAAPRPRQRALGERLTPYLFIAPFLVSFVVLFLGPALYSLVLSLYRYRGYGAASWVGPANYERLLGYHQFWASWSNTLVYWVAGAAVTLVVAFVLAVLVYHGPIGGKLFYKPAIFLPNVMAAVAAALVFQTLFAPGSGVVNSVLGVDIAWDQDALFGKLAVVALRAWHSIGWFFVIFLAGLTTINPELYDAAKVDGATALQSTRSITLPLMRRTFLFAVVIISITSLRMFAEPNLIFGTGDGLAPAAFQPIMNQLYLNLRAGEFGLASAVAWLIFVPIVVVSAVQFRLLRGDDGGSA